MKLKLKENPREWQKFAAVLGALIVAAGVALWRRHWIGLPALATIGALALAGALASWRWPRPYRAIYRVGMTLSFHVGQGVSRILLTAFFLLCVTPLGCGLRLLGHDLLRLRGDRAAASYWLPAKVSNRFDRMF